MQEIVAIGGAAPIDTSVGYSEAPTDPAIHTASTTEVPPLGQKDPVADVFSWEYVWVAVLVVAVLAGIGITAICLF